MFHHVQQFGNLTTHSVPVGINLTAIWAVGWSSFHVTLIYSTSWLQWCMMGHTPRLGHTDGLHTSSRENCKTWFI